MDKHKLIKPIVKTNKTLAKILIENPFSKVAFILFIDNIIVGNINGNEIIIKRIFLPPALLEIDAHNVDMQLIVNPLDIIINTSR